MRYRLMATYLGVPYHAGLGPDGSDVTLFSPGPPPTELGFTAAAGHWRKQVSVCDLSALWQSRLVGEYRDEPCLVLDDLGGRLHIVYLGRDAVRARQLGYWEIDREVFEVVVAREEVVGLTEDRVEFSLASATFPSSAGGPPPGGNAPSGTGPLPRAFQPAAAFARVQPPGPETEPDTLIHGRLDRQGHPAGRPQAESAGPQGRADSGVPAAPGYPGADRGSRTTDRAAAWHGSPAPEPWPPSEARLPSEPRPTGWPGRAAPAESRLEPTPRTGRETAAQPGLEPVPEPAPAPVPVPAPSGRPEPANTAPGRRTARRDRVSPQSVFAELLSGAGIPQSAYAVDDEVPGAMCLVKADGGFEVFSCTRDARLEVHFFEDEEAAYFYLFGVLAAEAIRSGRLGPTRPNDSGNGPRRTTVGTAAAAPAENVSKYLRSEK